MKNYLVNAGVNLEADTIGNVDLVKAKEATPAPIVDPKLSADDVANGRAPDWYLKSVGIST